MFMKGRSDAMRVYFEAPQRLRVELDRADLRELDVTYDELDYASPRTREVLRGLLERIGAEEEFAKSKRLLIEITPLSGGGCTVYFTAVKPRAALRQTFSGAARVWDFSSLDELYAALEALKAARCGQKMSLYLLSGRYRLIADDADRCAALTLSEFARSRPAGAAVSFVDEHGRLLSRDAVGDML